MRIWIFLFIIVILCLLQITILDYIKVWGAKPDLLLVSVVMASLYFDLKSAIILSGFSGILKDIFSLHTFGINTLLFSLWSFGIVKLSKKISLENGFICALLIFTIGISHQIITRLIFLFLGKAVPLGISLRIMFIESLYTAVTSLLLFKITKQKIFKQ